MKLITFSHAGFTRLGVVTSDNEVIDLNYAYQALLENRGSIRSEIISLAHDDPPWPPNARGPPPPRAALVATEGVDRRICRPGNPGR